MNGAGEVVRPYDLIQRTGFFVPATDVDESLVWLEVPSDWIEEGDPYMEVRLEATPGDIVFHGLGTVSGAS